MQCAMVIILHSPSSVSMGNHELIITDFTFSVRIHSTQTTGRMTSPKSCKGGGGTAGDAIDLLLAKFTASVNKESKWQLGRPRICQPFVFRGGTKARMRRTALPGPQSTKGMTWIQKVYFPYE